MKKLLPFSAGLIAGALLVAVAAVVAMPRLMIHEQTSPFGVEETVEKIKAAALARGWVVSGVKPLHESVRKNGGGELPPILLVELCQARHAHAILVEGPSRKLSAFMPCTVSVYRRDDGTTAVGSMNAGLLGRVFGGTVARVMGGEVARDQAAILAFLGK
ncbi:MAG: DUF302 domain-containing protein [Holophagales bacterium]|nr:DUF302 domain-containing protein [Holophagales bacterium]